MDAVPIVPPLFWGTKTRHFTSYKQATDHALLTRDDRIDCRIAVYGGMLSSFHSHRALFGLLPVWLLVRMACATIDGTLAIDFGQKSLFGGILNEVGDVGSDVVLLLPLAFVGPFTPVSVGAIVVLTVAS